jgi:hypothetical protein
MNNYPHPQGPYQGPPQGAYYPPQTYNSGNQYIYVENLNKSTSKLILTNAFHQWFGLIICAFVGGIIALFYAADQKNKNATGFFARNEQSTNFMYGAFAGFLFMVGVIVVPALFSYELQMNPYWYPPNQQPISLENEIKKNIVKKLFA